MRRFCLGLSLTLILVGGLAVAAEPEPRKVRFNEQIRPLLSDRCIACHGPDDKHREADLRLDTFAGATRDLGGYAAIVPGDPDASELLTRAASHDPDVKMPPPSSKRPGLTKSELDLIARWIREGAEYEGHWAFLPLAEAVPPGVSGAGAVNGIDAFVRSKLAAEGVAPSPEADRATLIRRVTLDLTGLLPTPDEVEAFVRSTDPQAYEQLVDRLLASPHYGERWGRYWLDQARYADSNGYSIDSEREMWPYRDWVIEALNRDMPFDQFTVEQLAGDLLPNATKAQIVATAFHRNTLINQEGGSDPEQFRVEAVMDRTATTGAVWMGLTVGCAQCHTHKFDPITHQEYYRLFAFFNSTADVNNKGPTLPVSRGEMFLPPEGGRPSIDPAAELVVRRDWEKRERTRLEAAEADAHRETYWEAVQIVAAKTASGAGFETIDDGSLLSDGKGAPNESYHLTVRANGPRVAAIRLRTLTHESLPKNGPGRAGNGNFVLTGVRVTTGGKSVPIAGAAADHEQPNYPAGNLIDADAKSGWAINTAKGLKGVMNADHEVVLTLAEPVAADGPLEIELRHDANAGYLVGRFAVDVSAERPATFRPEDRDLLAALKESAKKRTPEQTEAIEQAYRQATGSTGPVEKPAELMVTKELAEPRPTFLLTRGDFTRPDRPAGELVPGVLAAVQPPLEASGKPTRLDLAKWLVDPRNPLTPRVTVNRVWMRYFGRGIVETDDDFGTQGAFPTHPELLDWLSREFIRGGWRMKPLHRLIVTSATYRQASDFRADLADRDPRNLWLARQERLRLEAETIRDAGLCASGLIDATVGGPSVRPPQPDGVYAFTQTKKTWNADEGPARFRRGLYIQFYRSAPYPLLGTFDAPDFQTACTKRLRSNTPLQALTLANDVAFLEMARGLADRVGRSGATSFEDRLDVATQACFGRPAQAAERQALAGYFDRQRTAFAGDPAAAEAWLGTVVKDEKTRAERAAWVAVARVLLNTDAMITRE